MKTSPDATESRLRQGLHAVLRVLFTAKHSELAQPTIVFRSRWLGLLGLVLYVLLLIDFVLFDVGGISLALSGHEPMDWPARWITLVLIVLHAGPGLLALGRPLAAWRTAVVGALVTIAFALVISSVSGNPYSAWTTGTLGYLPVVGLAVARSRRLDAIAIGAISAVLTLVGSFVNPRYEVLEQYPLLLAVIATAALAIQAERSRRYSSPDMKASRGPRRGRVGPALAAARRVLFTAKHSELTPPAPVFRSRWLLGPGLVGYLALLWVVARDEFPTLGRYLTGEYLRGREDPVVGQGLWIPALLVALHIVPALVALIRPLAAWRMAVVGALASIMFAVMVSPVKVINTMERSVERLANGQLVDVTIPRSVSYLTVSPWTQATLAYLLVLGLVLARARRRDATAVVVISSVIALLGTFVDWKSGLPLAALPVCVVVVVAQLWRSQRAAELEGKLETVSRTARDEHVQRTVLEERARIARELHDVVAHHLSLIAVRTESAGARLGGLRDDVRAELTEIGTAARQALTETRQLLGVLRRDGDDLELKPQPSLEDLPLLIGEANASGVPTTLALRGEPVEVPANVGLAVYGVVREALSNARQHAPGAAVEVRLGYTGSGITVEVDNEPPAQTPAAADSGSERVGHGLTGMRERVSLAGGVLLVGARADGGFTVDATIPLGQPDGEV